MILVYILVIVLVFIFSMHILDMVKDIIDKECHISSQDNKGVDSLMTKRIQNILDDYWIAPEMYANNPASFEDQIHLFMVILHPSKDIWKEYQMFKIDYGILSTEMLSTKYDFESSPTIVEVMKDFCDSIF